MQNIELYKTSFRFDQQNVYTYCKNHRVSVMLEFIVTLASFKEGRDTLQEFLENCDEFCFDPSFIAQIIIAPVTIIVQECLNIIEKEQTHVAKVTHNKNKKPWSRTHCDFKYWKLRSLLRLWYMMQVVKSLILFKQQNEKKECFHEHEYNKILRNAEYKDKLGHLKDFAMMMLILPSEFQRWNDQYEFQIDNTSNKPTTKKEKLKPFDHRCNFDRSFVRAIDLKYYPHDKSQQIKQNQ